VGGLAGRRKRPHAIFQSWGARHSACRSEEPTGRTNHNTLCWGRLTSFSSEFLILALALRFRLPYHRSTRMDQSENLLSSDVEPAERFEEDSWLSRFRERAVQGFQALLLLAIGAVFVVAVVMFLADK
jgi:hypothetical protein